MLCRQCLILKDVAAFLLIEIAGLCENKIENTRKISEEFWKQIFSGKRKSYLRNGPAYSHNAKNFAKIYS